MEESKVDFRWGIPALDSGFTTIPNFVIRHYAELGVTPTEFAFVMHLASYKFDSPKGQASPALQTIAGQMGKSIRQTQYIRASLERKGFLQVSMREGRTSVYDFQKLALACLELESAEKETLPLQKTAPPQLPETAPLQKTAPPTPAENCIPPLQKTAPEEEEDKKKNPEEEKIFSFWETVLLELRWQMTRGTFNRWLEGSMAMKIAANVLEVHVCDDYAVDWCDRRLRPAIERTVRGVLRQPDLEVVFACGG